MKIEDILKLIDKLEESSVTKVVIDEEGSKIKISKESKVIQKEIISQAPIVATPTQVATVPAAPVVVVAEPEAIEKINISEEVDETGYSYITSPIVGTFYESSSPNADPYVKIGTPIKVGQIVCILEAMKLMNEIESEIEGEIAEILVKNEEMVEYGQKLFKVRIK